MNLNLTIAVRPDELALLDERNDGCRVVLHLVDHAGTPQLAVDGIIGAGTRTAIKAFQVSKSLAVDGRAGPQTLAAIEAALNVAAAAPAA